MGFSYFPLHPIRTELLLCPSGSVDLREMWIKIPQCDILLDLQSLHRTGLCITMDKPPDVSVYGAKQRQPDRNVVQALLSNKKPMRMQQRSRTKWSYRRLTNYTQSE